MENESKKCSHKKHSDIKAVIFCLECKRYLCNKCKINHTELFEDHHFCDIDKNINEIFTGFCLENNHNIELEYFCKTHNILCCAACVTKIKGEGKGQHSNCEVCLLNEIKDEKTNKIKENINLLQNLYNKLDETINNLKKLSKEINQNKEKLKIKIQKIFTKIRTAINEKEEKLLIEVDNEYNKYFMNEDIINKSLKLPKKIKFALEKAKNIFSQNIQNMKLNSLINDCINVENNAKEITNIYDVIKKCNSNKDLKINFSLNDDDIDKFIEKIKTLGRISANDINIESKIVSHFDMDKINNWLRESYGEVKKYELIYRASQNGDSNSISFNKCTNIPNLLWIMKDKNSNIFGCFNSVPIYKNNSYSKDMKCFLFSINKNKKYTPNPNIDKNIYHCSSHLIEFGNGQVWEFNIGDNFLKSNSVHFQNGSVFNHKNEICENNGDISLSELEVFKLI